MLTMVTTMAKIVVTNVCTAIASVMATATAINTAPLLKGKAQVG
jgi:hypothetical protein